ncbi:phosphatase PAP2 family protein [Larkinella soli]|uniref:phosphatase PAP2 family protein n=1 Tax=Larkinella soli TaxID=1770527 RepID=UPI0013E2DE4B|nr:phosphatase PAP2 family protein [Larkinella soli]
MKPTYRAAALLAALALTGLTRQAFPQDTTAVASSTDSLTLPQPLPKQGLLKRVATDGSNTARTILRTYAQPAHWQKRDFVRLGGVLAVSATALLVEKRVYRFMLDNHTPTLDRFERAGYLLGRPQLNYPIMLSLWGTGVLFNSTWLRDTGIMVVASVTTSGLLQTALKEVVGRPRPNADRGNLHLNPFGGIAYHSFPSGHATLATATFWVLAHQVGPVPLRVFFYTLPILTGLSRIYVGAHWLSDVLLGTAMGVAFAETVVRLYPRVKAKRGLSLQPTVGGSGAGVVLRF